MESSFPSDVNVGSERYLTPSNPRPVRPRRTAFRRGAFATHRNSLGHIRATDRPRSGRSIAETTPQSSVEGGCDGRPRVAGTFAFTSKRGFLYKAVEPIDPRFSVPCHGFPRNVHRRFGYKFDPVSRRPGEATALIRPPNHESLVFDSPRVTYPSNHEICSSRSTFDRNQAIRIHNNSKNRLESLSRGRRSIGHPTLAGTVGSSGTRACDRRGATAKVASVRICSHRRPLNRCRPKPFGRRPERTPTVEIGSVRL